MALSTKAKARFEKAMAKRAEAKEITDAIDALHAVAAAATVAALAGTMTGTTTGTMSDVAAIALSTTDTYSDAAVNTAVNTAITKTNLELKELQTKVNAILTSLKAASLMS